VEVWDKQEIKEMITRVKVKYFKSFEDFELANIGSFTCLIGLNGSGKTTFLQFFDFIRAMLDGRIEDWFSKHRWKPQDIITFGSSKRSVEFEIDVVSGGVTQRWKAFFNIQELRCTSETLLEFRGGSEVKPMSFSEINSGCRRGIQLCRKVSSIRVPCFPMWGKTGLLCRS